MTAIDLLRGVHLFAGLPEAELEALSRHLGKRTFGKGVVLFHKGSPGQTLYLVETGRVRIFVLSENGVEITLNLHGPGECFGELALLDGHPRSAGAMAIERTVTYTLQREEFLCCLEQYPRFTRRILELVSGRLRRATDHIESLTFLDVPGRLATVLLELAQRHGQVDGDHVHIDLGFTQAELATWAAASREMVNKVLGEFRDHGIIQIEGRVITILDKQGLQRRIMF